MIPAACVDVCLGNPSNLPNLCGISFEISFKLVSSNPIILPTSLATARANRCPNVTIPDT